MSQSKTWSFIESWTNVAIGYVINLVGNLIILPLFGFNVNLVQAAWIGVLFTGVSVARQYVIRRWFNKIGR